MKRQTGLALGTAVLALVALAGCSSSSSESGGSATPAPTESATGMASPVSEPVVLPYGTARTTVAVGQAIDFDVEITPEKWTIKSDDPKVVSVTPGSAGSAVTNPGAVGVSPGETMVQLTLPGGGKIWNVTVTVTG